MDTFTNDEDRCQHKPRIHTNSVWEWQVCEKCGKTIGNAKRKVDSSEKKIESIEQNAA